MNINEVLEQSIELTNLVVEKLIFDADLILMKLNAEDWQIIERGTQNKYVKEVLKNRDSSSCDISDHKAFGFFAPEYLDLLHSIGESEPDDCSNRVPYRYTDFPHKPDRNFTTYNGNTIEQDRWYIAEGPENFSALDPFKQTVNSLAIDFIVAIGPSFDGRRPKFYPYFLPIEHSDNIRTGKMGSVFVIHLWKWQDMQISNFQDDELLALLFLFKSNKKILTHCSAGLGRAGTLLLAMMLAFDFDTIFSGPMEAIAEKIANTLHQLRNLRPNCVQNEAQLEMAIKLAAQFKKLIPRIEILLDDENVFQKLFPSISEKQGDSDCESEYSDETPTDEEFKTNYSSCSGHDLAFWNKGIIDSDGKENANENFEVFRKNHQRSYSATYIDETVKQPPISHKPRSLSKSCG